MDNNVRQFKCSLFSFPVLFHPRVCPSMPGGTLLSSQFVGYRVARLRNWELICGGDGCWLANDNIRSSLGRGNTRVAHHGKSWIDSIERMEEVGKSMTIMIIHILPMVSWKGKKKKKE